MKELERNELMAVDGGLHSIMWYLGYAYGKVEGMPVGDLWLTFI